MILHNPTRLPLELIRDIFEYLADDLPTLAKLAPLCRVFTDESQRIMYRAMPPGKDALCHITFLSTILQHPHLAMHVVRYERSMGGDFGECEKVTTVFKIAFPSMARLREFVSPSTASCLRHTFFPEGHNFTSQLLSLHWLTLEECYEVEENIYNLIREQTALRSLTWFPTRIWKFPKAALNKLNKLTTNGNGLVSILPGRRVEELHIAQATPSCRSTMGMLADTVDSRAWHNFIEATEDELETVKKVTFGDYGRQKHLDTLLPRLRSLQTLVMSNLHDFEIMKVIRKATCSRLECHVEKPNYQGNAGAMASLLDRNNLIGLRGEWFSKMKDLEEVIVREESDSDGFATCYQFLREDELQRIMLRRARSMVRLEAGSGGLKSI